MERAKALKHQNSISQKEVRHLLGELGESLQQTQGRRYRHKLPGSSYTSSEVTRTQDALRSVLLAVEVLKRTHEATGASAALREQARAQLLKAIIEL